MMLEINRIRKITKHKKWIEIERLKWTWELTLRSAVTICNSVDGDGEDPASIESEVNVEKTRANRRIAIAPIASLWGEKNGKLSSVFSFNWFIRFVIWKFSSDFGLYGLWAHKLLDFGLYRLGPTSFWTFCSMVLGSTYYWTLGSMVFMVLGPTNFRNLGFMVFRPTSFWTLGSMVLEPTNFGNLGSMVLGPNIFFGLALHVEIVFTHYVLTRPLKIIIVVEF